MVPESLGKFLTKIQNSSIITIIATENSIKKMDTQRILSEYSIRLAEKQSTYFVIKKYEELISQLLEEMPVSKRITILEPVFNQVVILREEQKI
jgi:hypothetical protein